MSRGLRILLKGRALIANRGLRGLMRMIHERLSPQPYHLYTRQLRPDIRRDPAASIPVQRGHLRHLGAWRQTRGTVSMDFQRDRTDSWTCFHWTWIDGAPAGIVWTLETSPLVALGPDERVLAGLCVVPPLRNRGIGRALVAATCQDLAAAGITRVYATIHSSNLPSRKLFEISGFHSLGVRNVHGFFRTKIDPCNWGPASPKALVQHKGA